MIPFEPFTLDEWLNDYDSFNYAFRGFCIMHFKVHSLHADFVPNVTRQIHEQWVADVNRWLSDETDEKTVTLSHLKVLSILLYNLNIESCIGNMYDHEYQEDDVYIFAGTDEQKHDARRDLIDGRHASLSLDFCIMAVDWFERNRDDCTIPFKQPLTADMRHDLINYLVGGNVDLKALYLILKALYLRHGNGSAN